MYSSVGGLSQASARRRESDRSVFRKRFAEVASRGLLALVIGAGIFQSTVFAQTTPVKPGDGNVANPAPVTTPKPPPKPAAPLKCDWKEVPDPNCLDSGKRSSCLSPLDVVVKSGGCVPPSLPEE
jgi:hypothetical protein